MMEMESEKWLNFFEVFRCSRTLNVIFTRIKKPVRMHGLFCWEIDKEIDPESSVGTMKHKVSHMRGCYRQDLRKIARSERRSTFRVHVPHRWYFDQLHFPKGQPNISTDATNSPKEDDNGFYLQKLRKIRPEPTPLPTPTLTPTPGKVSLLRLQ